MGYRRGDFHRDRKLGLYDDGYTPIEMAVLPIENDASRVAETALESTENALTNFTFVLRIFAVRHRQRLGEPWLFLRDCGKTFPRLSSIGWAPRYRESIQPAGPAEILVNM